MGSNNAVGYLNANLDQLNAFATTMLKTRYVNALKDKDGNVNPNDVIACIITGMELGMSPMQSLRLADKLTNDGYLSILKGKELGIDHITSVENIHTITTKAGRSTFLGIHIVTKILRENKIDIKILLDFTPLYVYSKLENSKMVDIPTEDVEDEDFKPLSKFFIVGAGTTPDEVTSQKAAGKLPIIRREVGKRSAVVLTREGFSPIRYCFSTLDAINEGVYPGVNKFGEQIEGEYSWKTHTRSKMIKTCIERAGRIIADDKLHGSYTINEISHFIVSGQVNKNDPTIIEIQGKSDNEVI